MVLSCRLNPLAEDIRHSTDSRRQEISMVTESQILCFWFVVRSLFYWVSGTEHSESDLRLNWTETVSSLLQISTSMAGPILPIFDIVIVPATTTPITILNVANLGSSWVRMTATSKNRSRLLPLVPEEYLRQISTMTGSR